MLTEQVPGAGRRVRNPTGALLSPEIPGHNPNPSFRTPQAQGFIAEDGESPRRRETLDERAAGRAASRRAALVRPHLSPPLFSFSYSCAAAPSIVREASPCLAGSQQTATIRGRAQSG